MFLDNKYYDWYKRLTSQKDRELDCYTEKHHIIPRCMGGSDDKVNLVVLTAREHYVAHLLLTKCVANKFKGKILHAYVMMSEVKDKNQERFYKINSRLFESRKVESNKIKSQFRHSNEAKLAISEKLKGVPKQPFSDEHKANISNGHKGQKAWNKGLTGIKTHSEETKRKMSESQKGRVVSDETRKKISLASKGKVGKHTSEETKAKMRAASKRTKMSKEHKHKLSEIQKNTIFCFDKESLSFVRVSRSEYVELKGDRYITSNSKEYKSNYKEKAYA
jgi:hypothetical protein